MAWNRANDSGELASHPPLKNKKKSVTICTISAAGIVLVFVVLLITWLNIKTGKPVDKKPTNAPPPRQAEKATTIRETKRSKPPLASTNERATVVDTEKWDDSFVTNRAKRIKFSKLFSCTTNSSGQITERYRLPNGKTWRRQIDPPPLFKNASDNAIAMIVGGAAGAPIPPVPGLDNSNLNEAFAQSLLEPIEIKSEDSPGIAALKLAVKNARHEIAKLIKEGDTRSVGEILQDYVTENNRVATLQGDALNEVEKIRDEMGDDAANEYVSKINEQLKCYGVEPIKLGHRRHQLKEE